MSVRDFKLPKTGGIPIVGQTPPPIVRDALGRELQAGDFIVIQVSHAQPFRIKTILPVPENPSLMEVVLASTSKFITQRNTPNQEFLRIMTLAEVDAQEAQKPPAPEVV